jgi:hypothetical protein
MRRSNGFPSFEDQGFGRGVIHAPAPALCTECSTAAPESGADQCTGCLAAIAAEDAPRAVSTAMVTNKTGAYLRFHADMEHDAEPPKVKAETFLDVLIDVAAAGGFENIKFHPAMTLGEVGLICQRLSTNTHEIEARSRWINGKLVVALHCELRPEGLDAILRAGSDAPLSSLLRQQAS